MTMPITAPPPTGRLDERALCVDLTVHQWTGVTHDRRVDKFVANHHNTTEDAGKYLKKLGATSEAGKVLARLRKKGAELTNEHRRRTLPWHDGATRILSSAGYLEYVRVIGEMIRDYEALADKFAAAYPSMIDADRARLNGLFDPSDYPAPSRVRMKFGADYRVSPVPMAGDFRVDLGASALAACRAAIEADTRAALDAAMASAWGRVRDVVGKMVERLTIYSTEGDKTTGIFRDSMIANCRALVDLLPTLNVGADPAMDAVAQRMRDELLVYDADTLRDSLAARQTTARAAQDILDHVSMFAA